MKDASPTAVAPPPHLQHPFDKWVAGGQCCLRSKQG